MRTEDGTSIWLFVGISLLFNGVMILGAGVYQLFHPPLIPVVLYRLHANVWWGAILAVIGLAYCVYFAPGRSKRRLR